MSISDLLDSGLVGLANALAAQTVSSVELVQMTLTRIEALDGRLNAFITVPADAALTAARQADVELARGDHRGPLHGVPVTLKDLFFTDGIRTTGGSKLYEHWVPDHDAAIVERLHATGAVIVGKTNLDEFGLGGTSTLSHFGPVHNPWQLERMAGGSSGGSVAAVAAGIGPLSYGTETGASVRRPAAYCGVVGHKPTFGLVSRFGSFRGSWSMDHVGLFARSVADAALGLNAILGYDARDPASIHPIRPIDLTRLAASIRGRRIGILQGFLDDDLMTDAVRQAFDTACAVLGDLGVEIRQLDVPELQHAGMVSMLTSLAEAAAINAQLLPERAADYVTPVRRILAAGTTISAGELATVQRARFRLRTVMRRVFDDVDLIVMPTAVRTAPTIANGAAGNGDQNWQPSYNQSNLLRLPSMLGLPACSIPCGADDDGLPIGMQIIGPWLADERVLHMAQAYEAATVWHRRRPPLA